MNKEVKKIYLSIEEFCNLKNLRLEIVRDGLTVIVGKNNVGKTNLLNYIYEENEKWDSFEGEYEEKWWNEGKEKIPFYRKDTRLLNLFFSEPPVAYLLHPSHPYFAEKKKEGNISLSYKIYYFDLATSTSFLTKEGREEFKLRKIKSRSCEVLYGVDKEESIMYENFMVMEEKERPVQEETWIPKYKDVKNFIKHEEGEISRYRGFNKGICHSLDKLGSGYLKYETLKNLIEELRKTKRESEMKNQIIPYFPKQIFRSILLIDEPELLLNPSLISDLANFLKKLVEKSTETNTTIVITTHSPALLSYFVHENRVNLIIAKKDEEEVFLKISYFGKIKDEIKDKIIETWKDYCQCFKEEAEKDNNFYGNKWKSLLNETTLKFFFSKNVLFVEGISDYIFFTSEKLKKKLPEFSDIEVIPIFSKFSYIFFSELAQKVGVNYRFLLDKDRNIVEKAEEIEKENERKKPKEFQNCQHKLKCTREKLHERFWKKHTQERMEGKNFEDIIHDEKSDISWFPEDVECFLNIKEKDPHVISKELNMINNLEFAIEGLTKEKNERLKELATKIKKNTH